MPMLTALALWTLYVSTSGADTSSCGTRTAPCRTIQYTISNRLSAGDSIAVAPGTYAERLNVPIDATITGAGADKTIVDGGNRGTVVSTGAGVTLANLTVQHGKTIDCGAGIVNSGSLTAYRVTITANTAANSDVGSGQGGGVCNFGTLRLIESTVSANTAEEAGGIFSVGNGLLIEASTISGNSTISFGGGLETYNSTAIVNSTFSGNSAIYGGGISNIAALYIYNSTIAGNSAQRGGGIEDNFGPGGSTYLWNTILAGNSGSYSSPDCDGETFISEDHNLIGDTSGCSITIARHDVTGVPALLGPLENNGGPTLTEAPLTGSPAVDGGNPAGCTGPGGRPLTHDQRGAPRPAGPACDIGAVEIQN